MQRQLFESLEGESAEAILAESASKLSPKNITDIGTRISQNDSLSGTCWETVADRINYDGNARRKIKDLVRVKQKLEGILLLEDWIGQNQPSHTLFVLKSALERCNRPDIMEEFDKAVKEIGKVELLVAIKMSPDIPDRLRRVQCFKEMTNGEASLKQSLENRLDGDTGSYEVTSPQWANWNTQAKTLKGHQLTLTKRTGQETFTKRVVGSMEESAIMDNHVSSTNDPKFVPNIPPAFHKQGSVGSEPRCDTQAGGIQLNVFKDLSMNSSEDNSRQYYEMDNSGSDNGQGYESPDECEAYVDPDQSSYNNIRHEQSLLEQALKEQTAETSSFGSTLGRPPGSCCDNLSSGSTVSCTCNSIQESAAFRSHSNLHVRASSHTDRKRHLSENSDDEPLQPHRKSPPYYLPIVNDSSCTLQDGAASSDHVPGEQENMPLVEDYLHPDENLEMPPPLPPKSPPGTGYNHTVVSEATSQWPGRRVLGNIFIPRAALQLETGRVCGWQGVLSMEQMEEMMSVVVNEDGNYIIWKHEGLNTQDNKLVVTVSHLGRLLHYNIRARVSDGNIYYYLFKHVFFTPKIAELMQYYTEHALVIKDTDMRGLSRMNSRARHVQLRKPVLRGF